MSAPPRRPIMPGIDFELLDPYINPTPGNQRPHRPRQALPYPPKGVHLIEDAWLPRRGERRAEVVPDATKGTGEPRRERGVYEDPFPAEGERAFIFWSSDNRRLGRIEWDEKDVTPEFRAWLERILDKKDPLPVLKVI